MGAKHPEAVLQKLNANKNDFILAARHLIKIGVCKSPADAIRYMEKNNTDVEEVMEQIIASKQVNLIVEEAEEEETPN